MYDNQIQASMTLTVAAAAAPSQLTAVSISNVFQKNASANLNLSNFTLYDQYGSTISLLPGYSISVASSGLGISVSSLTSVNSSTVITAPNTVASYDLTFALKDASNNTLSSLNYNIQVVDAVSISSYQIEEIGLMYSERTGVEAYQKLINITGRTSTGTTVQLAYNSTTGLPQGISAITSTNSNFTTVARGGRLYLNANYTATGSTTISTWLKAYDSTGVELTQREVSASTLDPYMHNVYVENASVVITGTGGNFNFKDYVKAKDQYGVAYDWVTNNESTIYFSSNHSVATVNDSTDQFTVVGTGVCTLTIRFYARDIARTINLTVN